tara:strand:- start:248 stop:454 length:207 start_codon:yes stop_codon:yes gene_type:complete
MKKQKGVQVLSPDGFPIEFGSFYYEDMKDAKRAFERWKKRFENQGYYSSNNGRIPLDELEKHCQFKTI